MSEIKNSSTQISDLIQFVSFTLGNEEYGVDILKVQEIINIGQITRVPNARSFIEGVINLRGRIVSVVDLRSRLGLEKIAHTGHTRIIIVNLNTFTIGFIVDAVNEVLRIPAEITEVPLDLVTGINSRFIKAIGKLQDRMLIIIDLEMVLDLEESTSISTMIQ